MTTSGSGAGTPRGTADVFRLLPFVHHPPARVLLPQADDATARALDARGYRVSTCGGGDLAGITRLPGTFPNVAFAEYDLVCECGAYAGSDRTAYVDACARALRPGGLLFGSFPGGAADLLHRFGGRFDSARLEPSSEREGWFEAIFVRR